MARLFENKEGTAIGGQFTMGDKASDTKITRATGRIARDGCWFGNTRVGDERKGVADPYSVVLKRKKPSPWVCSGMLHHSLRKAALHPMGR
eukprot:13433094-Ditylum_brightwellii.AAC.1